MGKIAILNVKPGEQPPEGFVKMNRTTRRKYEKQVKEAAKIFQRK